MKLTKEMTRREFLRTSALMVGTGLLASCARATPAPEPTKPQAAQATVPPTSAQPTPAAERVTITIASCCYPEIHHKQAYDCMVKAFEQEHPNIHVVFNGTPWAEYWDKLTVEIAGGTEEDILEIQTDSNLVTYGAMREGEAGLWMNLDDKIAQTDFPKTIQYMDSCKYKGHYVGVPQVWGVRAVFYNKDVVGKAGADPSTIKTWTDLRQAVKQCTMDTDGDGTIDVFGFGAIRSGHSFTYHEWKTLLADQASGGFFYPEANCGPYTAEALQINHPGNIWAAQEWQSMLFDDKVAAPGDQDKQVERELFWAGKVGFHVDGPWFCGSTSVLHPEMLAKLGTIACPKVEYPAGSGNLNKPRQEPYAGVILDPTARTSHPEEVWTFLKWVGESPVAAECAGICGMIPSNIAYASSEEYAKDWPMNASFTKFVAEEYGPDQCAVDLPCYGEMEKAANVAAQAMYITKADVQKTMDGLQEEVKKVVADYLASS